MTQYADPATCPDCSAALPGSPDACPRCGLPLAHTLSGELFATLQQADRLLARLRALAAPAPVAPAGSFVPPMAPMPAPAPAPRRTGLRPTSVPAVLLGLGALCLLVAALIFLAVAWSWLGVGGRTVVLVGLTATAAGLGAWLAARGLRVAGEALATVAFGLLTLDVVGADRAGWLGERTSTELALVVGLALVGTGLAWSLAQRRLTAPQLVTGLGLLTAYAAMLDVSGHPRTVETLAVVAFAALAVVGAWRGLVVLPWVGATGAGLCWLLLTLGALDRAAAEPSLEAIWAVGGPGWALLAATGLLLLPMLAGRARHTQASAGLACAVALGTLTISLPVIDEGATRITLVAIAIVVAGTAAAAAAPRSWQVVPLLTAGLASAPVLAAWLVMVLEAAAHTLAVGAPFDSPAAARLDPGVTFIHPALVVPSALALVALAWVVGRALLPRFAVPAATALALSAIATLALHPVPLWTVVGALLATALMVGARIPLAGAAIMAGALVAGLPSAELTMLTTAVIAGASVAALGLGRTAVTRSAGAVVLPLATAGLLWSTGEVAEVDVAHRAIPITLVVGLIAIALHRWEVEVSAASAAWITGVVAVAAASNVEASLALHLTVAGALVSAIALVHRDRREAGWIGGGLLAAATWVRLAEIGVDAPEAYTLPSAVALLVVGLDRLRRDPGADTGLALVPGLALATTPSLLWCLADPISARAVLLGAACLALVLLGAGLRWNAPLVVGAVVGGLLVVREVAPYAAETPQWVLIGLAGALLTLVGVTWERRVVELRQTVAYLERLR